MKQSLKEQFLASPHKAMFLEEFFRYDLGRILRAGGTRGNALKVIFGQSASGLRFFEEKDPILFVEIFAELLSRLERVESYRAPNGTWTVTKKERIASGYEDQNDETI